jgi:hypothetical protein
VYYKCAGRRVTSEETALAQDLTRDEDSQPEVVSDNHRPPLCTASKFVLSSFHLFHLKYNVAVFVTIATRL